ncbi:MAG: Gfo/Idh/MocA family oxidoreductase [Trueperaceae bacterium]
MTRPTWSERPDDAPLRFGIVGCGDVTEVKSGPAFQRVEGAALSAVMRRDGAKAEDYARRHGVPRWTDDARELIFGDDVDAVYVATPPLTHLPYVLQAAEAGKPVYVEKPMGLTLTECRTMIIACERAGVPLFVAYYRRALPRFERVRQAIHDGSIGTPRMLRATLTTRATPAASDRTGWRFDPLASGGGLFVDLASHAFDLFDHWLGPVADVSGHAVTRVPDGHAEDEVSARFTFESGVHGVGLWGFDGATEIDEMMVIGDRGSVRVPLVADGTVVVHDVDGNERSEAIPHPAHVQEPLIRQLVEELRGTGGACVSTGTTAARTQGVLDAVLHEHRRSALR